MINSSRMRTPTAIRVDRAGRIAWSTVTAYMHGTVAIATIHPTVIGVVLYVMNVPLPERSRCWSSSAASYR